MSIVEVSEYVSANKEWLFSGVGVAFVTSLTGFFVWLYRGKRARAHATERSKPAASSIHPDRAPRIEFADGIIAEVALMINLELEQVFLMLKYYKNWEELQAAMTPMVHIRMSQIMEHHSYRDAKRLRPKFEKRLMTEFTPKYAAYGVRLKAIGIGAFVRRPISP